MRSPTLMLMNRCFCHICDTQSPLVHPSPPQSTLHAFWPLSDPLTCLWASYRQAQPLMVILKLSQATPIHLPVLQDAQMSIWSAPLFPKHVSAWPSWYCVLQLVISLPTSVWSLFSLFLLVPSCSLPPLVLFLSLVTLCIWTHTLPYLFSYSLWLPAMSIPYLYISPLCTAT